MLAKIMTALLKTNAVWIYMQVLAELDRVHYRCVLSVEHGLLSLETLYQTKKKTSLSVKVLNM